MREQSEIVEWANGMVNSVKKEYSLHHPELGAVVLLLQTNGTVMVFPYMDSQGMNKDIFSKAVKDFVSHSKNAIDAVMCLMQAYTVNISPEDMVKMKERMATTHVRDIPGNKEMICAVLETRNVTLVRNIEISNGNIISDEDWKTMKKLSGRMANFGLQEPETVKLGYG